MNIILASASPRRHELLRGLGIDFDIQIRSIDETYPPTLPTDQIAQYLAVQKALPFASIAKNQLIITADTLVFVDDMALGKPHDLAHAAQMLAQLSGRAHTVTTGVCLTTHDNQEAFSVHSQVYFKDILPNEINHYLQKHAPLDRAGSYGIQDWIGYAFIQKIEGCYYNVMGLPTSELYDRLKKHINLI